MKVSISCSVIYLEEQKNPADKEYFDEMINLIDYVMENDEKPIDVSDELQQIQTLLAQLKYSVSEDNVPSIIEEEQEYEDEHNKVNDFSLSKILIWMVHYLLLFNG